MRFPQLSAMPASSIREWLDHELEVRGIDAVIYTRYILSILQQDTYNLEPQERDLFPTCGKEKDSSSGKSKPKTKQKINKMKFADCEEMKRSAAVECLMSASEQKCGIEELVDELCSRLRSIHCDADYSNQHESSKSVAVNSSSREPNLIISSPEEQAEKYYAAFPALCISPKYEEFENSQHNRQCNTFWDGKKLLSDASSGGVESKNDEECGPQEASLHDVKVVYSSDKDVAVFCSESGVDTPSEKLTSKEIRDSKPGKYVSRHRDHHGLGNHHYPHHGKTFKSARDHGNGKPSFIVPKFKYGILKQRVPFFKGKSPFNAPQVKLKRFDAKCSSSSIKIPAELQCHFKKIEDNDNNYDSSFEDGDSEDAPLKLSMGKCPTRTPCISGQVVGDIKLPDNSLSPPSSLAEFQKRDNAKIDLKKDTRGDNEDKHHLSSSTDDQEVVRKLESKFNENLASIWSEQAKCETAPEKVSEMLESALMTSLSTWFSNLKKCDENPLVSDSNLAVGSKFHNESMPMADLEVCKSFHEMPNSSVNESRFDAEEYSKDEPHLKPDFDGFSVKNDKDDLSSNNIPLNDSYNEHKEDPSGIWYCESERNNFIKGGVYGFPKYHSQSDEDCTLSETDLYEISKGVLDTSSPAFESDVDTLFDERRSDLESKSVREDDVKLIWEVLGAINNDVKSGSQDEDSELLPVCPDDPEAKLKDEKIEGCNRKKEISVWEQLDHFDVWNMELISLKKNWDSTFPENANRPLPPFKDMSVLWDEAEITTDAVETLPVVTPNQDNALNLATALNWGGTESYHQSLWNIWKDGANDSTDVGSLIIECNLPNTVSSEEHLSMTRSYDSYLNKDNSGDGMDSLSKVQDQVHLSDPVLFGRKCTLTYHKGESLFVEVKHQKQDTNKWNSSRTNLTPGVLKSAAANVHLSNSVDDEPFNLYSSRNSDSTSNELEPYGDGDGYEEENLLTSPKTHFRPIRQLSCDSDDTLNSGDLHVDGTKPPTNLTDDIKVDKPLIVDYEIEPHGESIPDDDKPIFTEDESGILHLNSENEEGEKSCHHYMIYKGLESSKQQKEVVPAFVPKFKLRSNLEKFCQTEDLDGNQQRRWDQLNITENGCINSTSLESNYKEVHLPEIENDINHCERETESKKASVLKFFETISTFESKSMNSDNDWKTNTFENNHSYVVSQLEKDIISNFSMPDGDLNHYKNVDRIPETLWSAAEDDEDEEEEEEDEGCEGRDDTSPWPLNIDYNRRDNVDEKDFWAVDDKEDSSEAEELKTMKEEIKEEEAELFEDINQMRELDLHNDWDDGDEFSVNEMATMNDLQRKSLEWSPCNINLYQEVTVDCQEDEDCPELEMINGRQCELLSPWWLQNEDDGYTGEQDTADGLSSTCADWSSSYKEKTLTSSTAASHKFPVLPGGKVLFSSELEEEWMKNGKPFHIQVPKGSHIKTRSKYQKRPCTFYMDGNCRRTDCKFSHDLASITCRFWEEGSCFKGITCPFLHGYPRNPSPVRITSKAKQFLLESESDFPSLSKSADSTSTGRWMASALFSKKKKKRNRSRHHSSSVVEEDGSKSKSFDLKNP